MTDSDGTSTTWQPGDTIVLRYLTRQSTPGMSWPCLVVDDAPERLILYIPKGTTFRRWANIPDQGRTLVEGDWRRDTLRIMYPGTRSSIWVFWEGEDRHFTMYYVNMEEPYRRTTIGVDTNDHMLDVNVYPDGHWEWKDEDVLADRVRDGIYSEEFAAATRAEGERVIALLEAGQPPFSEGWNAWQPDPVWGIPQMPENWSTAPAVPWEDRHWAYGDAR